MTQRMAVLETVCGITWPRGPFPLDPGGNRRQGFGRPNNATRGNPAPKCCPHGFCGSRSSGIFANGRNVAINLSNLIQLGSFRIDERNTNRSSDSQVSQGASHDAASAITEEELRELAEDIVRYCPSLTQLLLALGGDNSGNPIHGMN